MVQMKRDYNTGVQDDVNFFVGNEIEKTPAYGMKTLFVVGLRDVGTIESSLASYQGLLSTRGSIRHIFFGANHSYNPVGAEEHREWEDMIVYFLNQGYVCSLDIPVNQVEGFNDSGLNEHNNFIPQIRIPLPYVRLWNYNTMIKIDDKDFNATNPGVWTHSLHKLKDRESFTSWDQYSNDEVIL
jgi:hypothetical protein